MPRRMLQIGGLVSGAVLIAFGVVVIVLAINGGNTVHDELAQQQIVALATALNVSYMATQLALFSLVAGIALVLTGIGFVILALGTGLPGLAGRKATQPAQAPVTGLVALSRGPGRRSRS
jgi:hypothetical protein